jgi:enoyl-CoA hydratase/carnithine racemase
METLDLYTEDSVRVAILNRPASLNAFDRNLLRKLLAALDDAMSDATIRAVVITGSSTVFSAGADLREPLDDAGAADRMELFAALYEKIACASKVTVAAISGPCIGAGVEVSAAADIRVADPTASFRFPGASLGFPVGAAKLASLVGLGNARDYVLTARTFLAEEALRSGFVQRLTEEGKALQVALDIGRAVASNAPEAIEELKRTFLSISELDRLVRDENAALLRVVRERGAESYSRAASEDVPQG